MATAWADIICNRAMAVIDDERLTEELALNPARFLRRMSLYMEMAIPLMSRPPELLDWLQTDLVTPLYGDFQWVTTEQSTSEETTLDTGMTEYETVSCNLRTMTPAGDVLLTPYTDFTYNEETGEVTFPAQAEAGLEYDLDFYKDGSFAQDLTDRQQRLLGLAIASVWDERFSRNWLNIQMKIKDSSFNTVNESNYMKELTARLRSNQSALHDALRRYEQDCTYDAAVRHGDRWSFTLL